VINIVVDFGNSRIKAGLFNESKLMQRFLLKSLDEVLPILSLPHDHVIVSSVKEDAEGVLNLSAATGKKIKLTSTTLLPVHIKYTTPHSLGVDRIAGVCGAYQLFPKEDCLIIDMGTCINYELLDSERNYWGGIISPGLNMRFEAMHTFTARLPLVTPKAETDLIGNSTSACMQSGVMNGILEEVKGIMARMTLKYPNLRVILCGGDSPFFENQLKPSIFAAPELVLLGLNRILIHNVQI
jgi:type III pantothenate kinase